jgi:hypothetical protein
LPNIRETAAADIKDIIEDANEAGTPYTLIDSDNEYPVTGTLSDIASLTNPVTGEVIQDRSIEATVIAQTILSAAGKIPARGWKVKTNGLDGKEMTLFVQKNEYDRTIGICLLTLGLRLKDKDDGE